MDHVYRLDTAVSKTRGGAPIFVNGRREPRFALVKDVSVDELVCLAKEAQLAAYHAWLEVQKAQGRPSIFKSGFSKEHAAMLPPVRRDAIRAAIKSGDKEQLVQFLDDLRLRDYESLMSLPRLNAYRVPLIVDAISRLASSGKSSLEVLNALLASHVVFSPVRLDPILTEFIEKTPYAKDHFQRHVAAYSAFMTARGLLLHPTKFQNDNVATAFEPSRYPALGGTQAHILEWLLKTFQGVNSLKNDQLRHVQAVSWNVLRASNIGAFADLTPDVLMCLVQSFAPDQDERGSGASHSRGALRHLVQAYSLYLAQHLPEAKSYFDPNKCVAAIAVPRVSTRQVEDFSWVLAKAPALAEWVSLARSWMQRGKMRVSSTAVYGMNHFFDFLIQLDPQIVCPADFRRHHVVSEADHEDPQTLWGFVHSLTHKLREDEKVGQATRNRVLASAQELLEFYSDQQVMQGRPPYPVPITSKDRVDWGLPLGKSIRQALPVRLLNRMKEILLSPDPEGNSTFAWAKQESTDWVRVINRATGHVETVYYPGRVILLYLLLATPLRSFQARWLDSGERDAMIYDFGAERMVPNRSRFAVKGKSDGVLRTTKVDFGEGEFLGLWINTNKTGFYEPGKIKGYGIPWCDSTVRSLIEMLLDWHQRYYGLGASAEPPLITLYDGEKRGLADRVFKLMPQFVPLFRDPGSDNRRSHDLPISAYRLRCIFTQLLAEVEMQFQAEGERLSLVDWDKPRGGLQPGQLALASNISPKVDLHTLRVTGITALIDAGVPVHVVSEFVAGHASVVMTMYYHHHGPTKVREMLTRAYEAIASESFDIDGLTALYDSRPEEATKFFLSQSGHAQDNEAFNCLKNSAGVATVSHSGICPGANCDEGGPTGPKGQPTPVPGGPGNCGQCRYWITGPAFLVGQIMDANTLMYKIRDKAEELKRIREVAKQARLVKESQGKLNLLAGRAEKAEREVAGLLAEWGARYRYIVISNQLLDEWMSRGRTSGGSSALVSAGSLSELHFTAKKAANLELLHMLGVQAELFPEMGTTSGAIAELELTIAQILAHNSMDGLLLTLSAEERLAVCNMFSETILRLTGGDEQTLNNITNGELKLSTFSEWQKEAVAVADQLRQTRHPGMLTFEGEAA